MYSKTNRIEYINFGSSKISKYNSKLQINLKNNNMNN